MKIGVFDVSSALPFYVAREHGFFTEAGLAVEDTGYVWTWNR